MDHHCTQQDGSYVVCSGCGLTVARELAPFVEQRPCNRRKKCVGCNWAMAGEWIRLDVGDVCTVCHEDLEPYLRMEATGNDLTLLTSDNAPPFLLLHWPLDQELPHAVTANHLTFVHQGNRVYRLVDSERVPKAAVLYGALRALRNRQ
jgi:hypothetical protein